MLKTYNNARFLRVALIAIATSFICIYSNSQSLDIDKKLGDEGAIQVEQQMGIYKNDKATNYVQEIGKRLADKVKEPLFNYNFLIVDMPEPNAFALPGGHIYVSRGILLLANSEAELAGVIGHEIIHSEERHSVKQMKKSITPTLLQLPGAIVGNVISEDLGNLINAPITAGSELFLSNYSRSHESEADYNGLYLAASAGYNPKELGAILTNLNTEIEYLTGEQSKFSYFDSHPYTPNRVKAINSTCENLKYKSKEPIAGTKEDFYKMFDGMYFYQNPANGIFIGDTFMHPDLNIFMTFPKGWTHANTPTYVGATDEEKQRGMVYLGMAEENISPEELGKKFAEKIKKEYKTTPTRAESFNLNGFDAYLVTITDTTGKEPVGIHNLWFKLDETSYQLVGMAYNSDFEKLKETALSIRKLTGDEKLSVKASVMRVVNAESGETIEELNKRTSNGWDIEMTAIMNNIPKDIKFTGGEPVKIIRKEQYVKN